MDNINNLSDTIIANSDRLNAEDLISGGIVITVTGVSRGNNDSPIIINYQNDNGKPFIPCKTVRKLLVFAWGEDGNAWVGRGMALYNDPTVKWAGKAVGGIRISHLSHINKNIEISLTATRGKKALYKIGVLQ